VRRQTVLSRRSHRAETAGRNKASSRFSRAYAATAQLVAGDGTLRCRLADHSIGEAGGSFAAVHGTAHRATGDREAQPGQMEAY